MAAPILDRRALNRALLARQLLLERSPMGPLAAVEHLVGMQAQAPTPPYFGLWARLARFDPAELSQLVWDRKVIRLALMRSTVHLVSAADGLALRPALQPVIDRGWTPGSPYGRSLAGVDRVELAAAGRKLVDGTPMTGAEIGRALQQRWPGTDVAALAFGVRSLVPLVQVPPRGTWGGVGQARCTSAEHWLGRPLAEPDLPAMLRRYLAAYGPASVRDAQAWSGLTGLGRILDGLRPGLLTFRDESGVELFDVSEAPRPPADLPVPVRLLPDFDSILLAHADRSRMFAPEHRRLIFSENGIIRASVLVDGFVRALWKVDSVRSVTSRDGVAVLTVTPLPADGSRPLTEGDRADIVVQAHQLLEFAAPGRTHEVRFGPSASP